MFIELTDHLRCTAEHEESFLVLLPDRMNGRRVERGSLGCPVCGRVVTVVEGVVDFGEPLGAESTALTPEAISAFAGLDGPGGYLALLGGSAALAPALAGLLPGIRLVLVNPPVGQTAGDWDSVVKASRMPVRGRSMRAVVVARDHATRPDWLASAGAAVLPGNRLIVEGPRRDLADFDVVAEGGGVWVGRRGGSGRAT